MKTARSPHVKVADEVWIATALLHRGAPDQVDFSVEEIIRRVQEETALAGVHRPGFYVHVIQHCVANRPPNPGRYRMLLETAPGRRRLFRPTDAYNPGREGGKITPAIESIPSRYRDLLLWYEKWTSGGRGKNPSEDPLLALRGSGKNIWADEHADEYISRLRDGWR